MNLEARDIGFGSFFLLTACSGSMEIPLPPPRDEPQREASLQLQVDELWKWVDIVKSFHRDASEMEMVVQSRWISAHASLDGYRRALGVFSGDN